MKADLESAFWAAVDAAHPEKIMAATLPPRPEGLAYVFAVGKAAIPMAQQVETLWGWRVAGHGYRTARDRWPAVFLRTPHGGASLS